MKQQNIDPNLEGSNSSFTVHRKSISSMDLSAHSKSLDLKFNPEGEIVVDIEDESVDFGETKEKKKNRPLSKKEEKMK